MLEPGTHFGKWTVGERSPTEKYYPHEYLCTCECGAVKVVRETNLKNGRSKSCGCQNPKRHMDQETRAKMMGLIETGMKPKEIAAACGVTVASVYYNRRLRPLEKPLGDKGRIAKAILALKAIDWRVLAAEGDCENPPHPDYWTGEGTIRRTPLEPHRCGECVNCRVLQALNTLQG